VNQSDKGELERADMCCALQLVCSSKAVGIIVSCYWTSSSAVLELDMNNDILIMKIY
jgi:hypothetical protein